MPETLARDAISGKPVALALPRDQFMKRQQRAFQVLREAADQYSDQIVYPHEALCATSECSVMNQQYPLYCDDDHLSVHGALYLTPMFETLLKPTASGSPTAQALLSR